MALPIIYRAATGQTFYATLTRSSDGYQWRQASVAAWESPGTSTFADRKIALTEGSAEYAGRYAASVTGLGDAGDVEVSFHDSAGTRTPSGGSVYVWGGNEVPQAIVGSAMTLAADAVNAAALATDAVAEMQGGLATAAMQQADIYVDTSTTPWDLVWMTAGTGGIGVGTELMRKSIHDVAGANLTSTATVVGQVHE